VLAEIFFPLTKLYFIPSSAFNASRARFCPCSHLHLVFEPQLFLSSDFPSLLFLKRMITWFRLDMHYASCMRNNWNKKPLMEMEMIHVQTVVDVVA
jgi:hypothetical protein